MHTDRRFRGRERIEQCMGNGLGGKHSESRWRIAVVNEGDMVVDGNVLQLGCGCDSTRVMRGKLLYQRG